MTTDPVSPVISSLLNQVERVPISNLHQYPGNPNEGNVEEIAKSLTANALFEPVIVQRSTSYILSHNHVTQAAQQIGWTHLDVIYVDVSDTQAKRIVAAANRTAELSTRNDYLLAELLREISDDDLGLDGTGYDEAFLDDLLERTTPPLDEAAFPDDNDEDGGYVMPAGPTGAHYAENDQQAAARTTHIAGEKSLAAQGLAEVIIVMSMDDKSQLLTSVEALREHLGDQPTGPILQAAVRIAQVVLESAKTNAPPADWNHLLGMAAIRPPTESA